MTWTTRLFFISLTLFLVTPMVVIGGLQSPYLSTRIILWAISLIGILVATSVRAYKDSNFRLKIARIITHPIIVIYGLFILWLFVRSLPIFSGEVWWGSLVRTDGLYFELSWLLVLTSVAAWKDKLYGTQAERTIMYVLGGALVFSTLLFPLLTRNHQFFGVVVPSGRFAGSVGNPLYLASLLLFVPWFTRRCVSRLSVIIVFIATSGVIIMTDTRGVFLAIAVGSLIYIYEHERVSNRARVNIAIGLVIIGIVVTALFATGKITYTYRSSTIATRITLWKSAIQSLAHSPIIGFGMGEHINIIDRANDKLSSVSYGEVADSTHSWFLDIALKGGLVACGLLLLWLIVVYRALGVGLGTSSNDRALARAIYSAFIIVCATAPFMIWTTIPLVMIIALYIEPRSKVTTARIAIIGGAACAFIIVISSIVLVTTVFSNSRFLFIANQGIQTNHYIELPKHGPLTARALPFTTDTSVSLLRMSMPSTRSGVSPSYEIFIEDVVKPVFLSLENRALHPIDYNVAATWANMYATSGLTPDHKVWLQKSLDLQKRSFAINPNRPVSVFQIADTLRELGRIDEAIAELKRLAEHEPQLPEAQIYYGIMVDISGDIQKAYEIEQHAKNSFPQYHWSEDFLYWFTDIEARERHVPASK